MKILILANHDGDLYNFRFELINHLVKNNHQIFISIPFGSYIERFELLGCKMINTKIYRRSVNPLQDIKLWMNYRKMVKKIKPDVVLTYTIKPNVYGGFACGALKVPFIVNITGLGTAVENSGILQKITLALYKSAMRKASCVFFQNQENMNFFLGKKLISKDRSRLIPGSGVNLERFGLLDYPEGEEINFLYIGRLMAEKGIEQYLDAAEYIKSTYHNTSFHILGEMEEDYEARVSALQQRGVVQYHGCQDDVRVFHAISSCTIHPSYYPEGMSNVLLESAASGRPVITTNRSGCREIVDDGVNGYFIEKKNSQDLRDKIERFLALSHEERRQMGLAGRRKVENEFSRQIVIQAYYEEIEKIRKRRYGDPAPEVSFHG